jgi:methylenetetrahydrofolate--tRNA-(uracil-5-)-methyltransferase
LAGRFAAAERLGEPIALPPPTTAHGALLNHITGGHVDAIEAGPRSFQPMNVNFGLFPPLAEAIRRPGTARTLAKKQALSARALGDLEHWIGTHPAAAAE